MSHATILDFQEHATSRCPQCGETKPLATGFNRDRSRVNGHARLCKECRKANWKICNRAHWPPEKLESYRARQKVYQQAYRNGQGKGYQIAHTYNITLDQYDWMLAVQGGVCAICGKDEPGFGKKRFSVDHDHQTGLIRGLLCGACNTGIGYLGEDIGRLQRAIAYLKLAAKRAG